MTTERPVFRPRLQSVAPVLAAAVASLLSACASTQLDAQWADPQLAPGMLRGARVLVACEAYDLTIKRICQDQLAAEVVARGASPLVAADTTNPAPGRPLGDDQYLGEARRAGARAVFTTYITPSAVSASPGFSVGIGGFGMSRHGVGAGVGVSAPIGGGQLATGYASNSRLTDATSGKLMWTARATAPPSNDVTTQTNELVKAVFGAADKSQLF